MEELTYVNRSNGNLAWLNNFVGTGGDDDRHDGRGRDAITHPGRTLLAHRVVALTAPLSAAVVVL